MEPPFGLHLVVMIGYEVLIDRYRTKKTTTMAHRS